MDSDRDCADLELMKLQAEIRRLKCENALLQQNAASAWELLAQSQKRLVNAVLVPRSHRAVGDSAK